MRAINVVERVSHAPAITVTGRKCRVHRKVVEIEDYLTGVGVVGCHLLVWVVGLRRPGRRRWPGFMRGACKHDAGNPEQVFGTASLRRSGYRRRREKKRNAVDRGVDIRGSELVDVARLWTDQSGVE